MKKQLQSFHYAFRGIGYTILHEDHFRFHLVAAAYIIFFGARFYHFSRGEWAVLIVLLASVLAAECTNTAIERVADRVTLKYNKLIEAAKDVAAGAVLVFALAAVAVAVLFFWDIAVFKAIFDYYMSHILELVLLILSAVISVLFIVLTPRLFGVKPSK